MLVPWRVNDCNDHGFFGLSLEVMRNNQEVPGWRAWNYLTFGVGFKARKQSASPKIEAPENIHCQMVLPSRELTYPTWGRGKSSLKVPWKRDMLVPWRLCFWWLFSRKKTPWKTTNTLEAKSRGGGWFRLFFSGGQMHFPLKSCLLSHSMVEWLFDKMIFRNNLKHPAMHKRASPPPCCSLLESCNKGIRW